MKHIDEDELTLYYYGEAENPEQIKAHLEENPASAAAYAELCELLEQVKLPVPDPGPFYEKRLWGQLQSRIEQDENRWFRKLFQPRRFIYGLSFAALFLAVFLLGRYGPKPAEPVQMVAKASERLFQNAVNAHLENSQMYIQDLANTDAELLDLEIQRQWARELIDDNRLYRQVASRAGDASVTTLLDELEFTLLEIANGSDAEALSTIESISQDGDATEIVFKIRVLRSKLEKKPTPENEITNI